MANNFKSDDSFLRKLAIGAAGTNATIKQLRYMGFNPIELERGSTGFKIWKKIKIKRIRVPDILCLNTGLRFESRGKTKPEISMSHSLSAHQRVWDIGLRDDDYVSIIVFKQKDDSPIELEQISPVHFINVGAMREAFNDGRTSTSQPKGVEEGSEIRVLWPCAAANQPSIVTEVSDNRIRLNALQNNRLQTIQLSRRAKGGQVLLEPQAMAGQTVEANQIVAAIVPVYLHLSCPPTVGEAYFIGKLHSVNMSERYAAAKALRYRGYTTANPNLVECLNNVEEDIYVKLEAAAALAVYNDPHGWEFIENQLHSSTFRVPLETQLETVIVASEIQHPRSERLLIEVLQDQSRDEELRAGAAWALGQFTSTASADALVDTFNLNSLEIKIEAARALLRVADEQIPHLLEVLRTTDPSKRDGISWALARTGQFNPSDLIPTTDDNLRKWISYIIGYGKERFEQADIENILSTDPEIYFAASVLWQILESWVNNLREY